MRQRVFLIHGQAQQKSDFITAAYDIKSGIASLTDEGVAQFTELAALTGKATKSTTEEMGSLFATGYGIYKVHMKTCQIWILGKCFQQEYQQQ